jgi:biotin carboxylase
VRGAGGGGRLVDYLLDVDTRELYLGELNPRLSGVTSMTSVSAGAYADMPLVLLHLAEYLDIDYELDAAELNERWARTAAADEWSQLIIKETRTDVELLTAAPQTGIWRLSQDGSATLPPAAVVDRPHDALASKA